MGVRNMQMVEDGNGVACEDAGGVGRSIRLVALSGATLVIDDHLVSLDEILSNHVPDVMVAIPARDEQERIARSDRFKEETCSIRCIGERHLLIDQENSIRTNSGKSHSTSYRNSVSFSSITGNDKGFSDALFFKLSRSAVLIDTITAEIVIEIPGDR